MIWESIKKKNTACKECNYLLVSLDFCPNLCNSREWYTCDNVPLPAFSAKLVKAIRKIW